MRLSIACEKRKDELKNFLSKYGCQKATKKGKSSKIRCPTHAFPKKAGSEKGNENRGNPRNPLPFSACEAGKGNEKRETQQNSMPLPPARSEKGNENRGNPQNSLPLSAIATEVIFIQEKEKNIKFVKKCLRKIKLSFIIIYMEIVTKIKGIYYEGRKGYDEKKNT